MNPQQSSRDEIEMKITALLLGELPADEAKLLRYTISQDAGLKKLHDELAQTIVLVREVEKAPASAAVENAAPLKLSEERRAKLFAQFKTPRKADPLFWLKRIDVSRIQAPRLLTVLAVLAIVAVLAAMMLPALSKAKFRGKLSRNDYQMMGDGVFANGVAKSLPSSVSASSMALDKSLTPLAVSGDINVTVAPTAPTDSASTIPQVAVTVAPESVLASSPIAIVLPPTEVPQLAASAAEPQMMWRGTSRFAQSDFSDGEKLPASAAIPEQKAKGINFEISSDAAAVAKANTAGRDSEVLFSVGRLKESADKPGETIALNSDGHATDVQGRLASVEKRLGLSGAIAEGGTSPATEKPATRDRSDISGVNNFGLSGGSGGGGAGGGGGASVANDSWAYFDGGVKRFVGEKAPANLGEELRRNAPAETSSPSVADSFAYRLVREKLPTSTVVGTFAANDEVTKSKSENSDQRLGGGLRGLYDDNYKAGDKFYRQTAGEVASVNGSIAPGAVAAPAKPVGQTDSLFFAGGNLGQQAKELDGANKSGNGTFALGEIPKDSFQSGLKLDDVNGLRYAIDPATGLQMSSPAGGKIDSDTDAKLGLARAEQESRFSKKQNYIDLAKAKDLPADVVAKLDQPSRQILVGQQVVAARKSAALEDQPLPKPALNTPVPQPEILTRENNFSTFSLNVSDVSFKLAAATLEKGQLPDAASIRSEEFINAFDYRDSEAAAGQPLAFVSERARYPFAQNRDLLRFSVKTAAAGRAAGQPLNLVLLLDNSGSMERADRVAIIREALRVLGTQLQPQDKVSVVTFARTARLWADGVSGDKAGETLKNIGCLTPEGGTNLEEAMRLAYETAHRHYAATGMNRVVLLTDGAANLGDVNPADLKQKVEAQRKQGIALDCFGIGQEDYNDDLLEQLSRNGDGRYAFLNSPEEVSKEFASKLAGALQIAASDVKVQVEFNPQRVISYRQIGYAKHQLTKQQFRDNTVDAAEIAAQEAGNALYTVETKADGIGPIATVRVRYKVPGTTDYRERSWEVPYDGSAVSLAQSSAAMRLAATASAFSEWLVASPFAQEVTPDELLKTLSGVPQIYGADQGPQKLEWMIRQAKSVAGK